MVLHGNRLEDLRDLLVQYLAAHPLPVLQPEVILLQSNGMKHWLELALADDGALGICAATQMALPSGYLWQMYRAVLGADAVPAHMPFDKTALLWRLWRLLPALCQANAVYAPLKRYLSGDNPARKRYQLALQVADVLDGYQSYRADWLADWAGGQDQLRGPLGAAQALPPEHAWQAQLWRDIRADVGSALQEASRASVHERFVAALASLSRSDNGSLKRIPGAPQRLIVFGISSLPMQAVQALAALGQVCQVLMLVQNPCQYYWGDIVEGHAALRQQVWRRQPAKNAALPPQAAPSALGTHPADLWRDAASLPAAGGHPLLASWGKQGRDYLHLLDGFDQPEAYRAHWSRVDVFVDPVASALMPGDADAGVAKNEAVAADVDATMAEGVDTATPQAAPTASQLAQLQSAILNLTPAPLAPQHQPDDGSLQFITCHSAQRELEVLHDQLLAWLDADPALQARDVMVMVPDMPTFAPHIHAVFGRFTPGQLRHIPYAVADTTARQSPLVQALEQLLKLPDSRLTLADWLALFEVSAVRARFCLDEAGVQQLHTWLAAAGVRWGLDAAHRLAWGLPAGADGLAHNTWAFGLRRLLLGYALGNPAAQDVAAADALATPHDTGAAADIWMDTLAQPALGGLDAPLLAGLLAWLQAIEQTLPTLQAEQTPAQWCQTLQTLVARFFDSADEADERALARLLEPLDAWRDACDAAQLDTALPLEVVREHWLAQIAETGLQQRFFGGGVQFGTLMPMRAIPFKLICMLGMNDGAYPRVQAARDFDLMASSWRTGDRSRREDDRYLFLEALLSARQKLYISWQGHSAADNSTRPPSVLVAQLLDHINACWSPPRQPQAQPLQPFSSAYFEAGSPFTTYATDWARLQPAEAAPAVNWMQAVVDLGSDPESAQQPPVDPQHHPESDSDPNSVALHQQPQETTTNQPPANIQQAPEAIKKEVNTPASLRLADLQRLLRQPVEVFFRNRLQVEFDSLDALEQEDEPFALNHLQQHSAGAELLQAAHPLQAMQRLHAAGSLPLAGFGRKTAADLLEKAHIVLQVQASWRQRYPEPLPAQPLDLALEDGTLLTGTLADFWYQSSASDTSPCLQLAARTGAVLQGKDDSVAARVHVLAGLWVRHLAACASGFNLTSVQLGVDGQVRLKPLTAGAALSVLNRLARAYTQAWAQPLPLACKTAWAYLLAQQQSAALVAAGKPTKDPHDVAQEVFEGGRFGGEISESAYLQRAFASYDELADALPHWASELYADLLAQIDLSQGAVS